MEFFKKILVPFSRFAIFVIYFWFGLLKVVGMSPASPLVQALFERTMPIMPFTTFLILFGLFEMLIGILFLIKGVEKIAMVLFFIHMITTIMPLFMVMGATWSGFLVPTLEGQYIIKNLALIAAAIAVFASVKSNSYSG